MGGLLPPSLLLPLPQQLLSSPHIHTHTKRHTPPTPLSLSFHTPAHSPPAHLCSCAPVLLPLPLPVVKEGRVVIHTITFPSSWGGMQARTHTVLARLGTQAVSHSPLSVWVPRPLAEGWPGRGHGR